MGEELELREYGGMRVEEQRKADYGGIVQPSQQHVAPCVKAVEWGSDTRGLKASFFSAVRLFNMDIKGAFSISLII